MKQCPLCLRTYADDAISFCLADGSLLSPPFGFESTEPATEILPPETEAAPPTQPAKPPISTINSLPGYRSGVRPAQPAPRNNSITNWIVFGIAALAIAIGSVMVIQYAERGPNQTETSQIPPGTGTVTANSPPSEAKPATAVAPEPAT